MIRTFSKMLDPDDYTPMSRSEHSELRASADLQESTIDSVHGTLSISIKYTFSSKRRTNAVMGGKKYSSDNPFVEIYEDLVTLNQGHPFIDTYFEYLFFPFFDRKIRRNTRALLNGIKKEHEALLNAQLITKIGAFDKRTSAYKKLKNFDSWKDSTIIEGFDIMSLEIKQHIKQCLAVGRIPLFFHAKDSTAYRRTKLGLTPVTAFFATGQLIDNLIISYKADFAR
jgi:hypothetical protein